MTAPLAIWLAPLRGVTLYPFRRRLFEYFDGISGAVAPFVPLSSSGASTLPVKLFSDVAAASDSERIRTVAQVIGRDPASLAAAAKVLRSLGYTRMNLNCGCPWKFVARKGRGSGLLEHYDDFARMLEAGCKAMPGGFSIKVRLGYKSRDTLQALLPLINSFPLERVFLHPRTGVQMYGGKVDMEAFAALLPLFKAPVVYNGDILSVEDAIRIATAFPTIDGLMIGRGLCSRPDLAERIQRAFTARPPSLPGDQVECDKSQSALQRIKKFASALDADYASILSGPAPLLGRLKELWKYLHLSFESGDEGLRKIQRSTTPGELRAAVDRMRESC